jgi:hypothetical protein
MHTAPVYFKDITLLLLVPLQVCNQHGKQAQWSNHGILKACLEGSPLDKLAAVATVQVRRVDAVAAVAARKLVRPR